jgi:predicted cupin superfamily sugar epimerase
MKADERYAHRLALLSARQIIELLNLKPHPEGGYFVETFRDAMDIGARAASTAIYFLLMRGERSNWHRIDAAEVWHYYAGAPLELEVAETDEGPRRRLRLGTDLLAGERPQAAVPRGAWQAAESLGAWTLVGCTVAPGFEFAGFELAPHGWAPDHDKSRRLAEA